MSLGLRTIVVTGASGFIGGAIAERLVGRAVVRSLTSHPQTNRFGSLVSSFPYDFSDPARMIDAFLGADVFVNTYYVRFEHAGATFEAAVEHSRLLLQCAARAGVSRVVHVSVSKARENSELPYYRNKARIERLVRECGLDYAILRPALVFGPGDILLNNIAYFLRRLPVFGVFDQGDYRVQPIELGAFADLCVQAVDEQDPALEMSVAGPVDYRFIDLVTLIKHSVCSRALIARSPAWIALAFARAAGWVLNDVVLTREEAEGLIREYLMSENPERTGMSLEEWLAQDAVRGYLGRHYASELARHFR